MVQSIVELESKTEGTVASARDKKVLNFLQLQLNKYYYIFFIYI